MNGKENDIKEEAYPAGMLSVIIRFCSGEALMAAEKEALEAWVSGSPERKDLLTTLSDPKQASELIRLMLRGKFGPGRTPPPNGMVEWINEKTGSDLPTFYFG